MRLFTIDEANSLLPELRRRLRAIDRQREVFRRLEPEARRASECATAGGGTPHGGEYASALSFFLEAVQQVLALGIEIKDFDRGLFDFPHLREGKVVLLCWQRGEDQIEWWHDMESGFAGRQPL